VSARPGIAETDPLELTRTAPASVGLTRSASGTVPVGYSAPRTSVPLSGVMEPRSSPADDLPSIYRSILDGIAVLEGLGARREAASFRAEATKIYSTAWDEAGLRRLRHIKSRIERIVAGEERPRTARARTPAATERSGTPT
jgi:hypothetical protein